MAPSSAVQPAAGTSSNAAPLIVIIHPRSETTAAAGSLSWVEHFQGSGAGVDLIVMGELGEAFENPEQLLVPRAAPDLHIAGAALRAERPKARQLVATLRGRRRGEAVECAHEMLRLALAGLPRILAKPDADRFAVLCGGVAQQALDVTGISSHAHHIQHVVTA